MWRAMENEMWKLTPGKFYVVDRFGPLGEVISGPFDTPQAAETDRTEINIADDCFVVGADSDGNRIASSEKLKPHQEEDDDDAR